MVEVWHNISERYWCLHLECLESQLDLRLLNPTEVNHEKLEELGSFGCYRCDCYYRCSANR